MDSRATTQQRIGLIPVVLALLLNLFIGPLSPLVEQVAAAPTTLEDEQGANDEPGQKDLTRLVIDYAGLPTSVDVSWNWDEISWSGANTGDACALFDTNDNLNVDAALCVTIGGDPATLLDVRLYECEQDAKVDRCTGPAEVASPDLSDCTVSQTSTDPFTNGDEYPLDTTAVCEIFLAEVAAVTAELVNVCSYPSQEPNSDPSDCVLIIRDGALRVTKVVINDNGGEAACTAFSFTINPGAVSESFEADCSNLVAVAPGTYSVTEPAVAGYSTSYNNCSNVAVASGETETCTITNNDQAATLTVTKVVTNDDGGNLECDDFSFSVDGGAAVAFEADCTNVLTVAAGNHSVTETPVTGYATSYANSQNANANCTSLSIALGGSATCTITNDDEPGALTVTKVVTNDDGGLLECDDFSFTVNGGTAIPFEADCTNVIEVDAGTYSILEPAVQGYTTSYENSLNSNADCSSLSIGLDGAATCTITNDDQAATLTVVKDLTNDDGGSLDCEDFSFSVNGDPAIDFEADCSNELTVDAGTYTVVETAADGYTTSYSNCTDVAIPNGGSATCTISNDDQAATLTVIKSVEGGELTCDDFGFTVNGDPAIDFEADCSNELTVDAGQYSIFEPSETGYTTTYANSLNASENCTNLVLVNGGSATCTITNVRDTGTLTVIKDLSPGDDAGRFNLEINDSVEAANVGDGGTTGAHTLDTGTHTVGETAGTSTSLANYASSIECVDDGGAGDVVASGAGAGPLSVEVTKGADIVCVISNERVVVGFSKANDEGENAAVEPGDTIHFTLTVTVNTGTATNVVVTDILPDGLTYVSGSADPAAGFSVDGQDLEWIVGSLGAGAHTFEYDATVDADASGTLTNLGCVDVDQNDDLVCDETTLRVQNISVTKTNLAGGSVVPGTAVDFTLTLDVANGPIDDVTIVDQLPSNLGAVTAISDGGSYDATTNRITWNLTDVSDDEVLTYRAVVSSSAAAGALTNVATITEGPCVGDGCEDDSTVIVRVPTLVLDKVASTETIVISGPNDALVATPSVVTWTLSYTLTSGPVTGAVITDTIPAGFTFLDASNGGTFADGTVTWNLGTLSSSGSVTFRTTVNPATISRVAPTVNIATIDSNETAPDSGQDSVTVSVEPPPLAGTPTPKPSLPDTASGIGPNGQPVTVPVELLAVVFLGSLGALVLANARARTRRW